MRHKPSSGGWQRFAAWVNGDWEADRESPIQALEDRPPAPEPAPAHGGHPHPGRLRRQLTAYRVTAVLVCLVMVAALLYTVAALPYFGSPDAPTNNEVSRRYLERGVDEAGATNAIAGVILFYRAFDTFGEGTVLFAASMAVVFLMLGRHTHELEKRGPFGAPNPDPILQTVGKMLLPFVFLYGIYVVVNGHLSPGGGFSGGAILGGGLILASSLFGQVRLSKKLTPEVEDLLHVVFLIAYAVMVGYNCFCGNNGVGWEVPKGTPGNILSAGFILPLNVSVGIIVASTMFTFYSLFSQGEEEPSC